MRFAFSAVAVLTALILPAAAHADNVNFAVTGHGLDLTFTLPSSPTPAGFDKYVDFFLGDVSFTENGTLMTASDAYFYRKLGGGGFELDDISGTPIDGLNFYGPKLFTGGVKAPTFKQGDFLLTGGPACSTETDAASSSCDYSLSIDPATTVTPEPSSLALLGTGVVGALGILRRRFLA